MKNRKWAGWDKEKAKRLVIYLEGLSTEQWTKSKILEKVCGYENQTAESHERKIRFLIKTTVRKFGIPIVSGGNKGYKIALIQEDIDQYKKRMYAQWNGIKEGIDDVQLAFNLYNKGHVGKFSDLIDTSKPKRIILKMKGGDSGKTIF